MGQSKRLRSGRCWQEGILVLSAPERGERKAREGEEDVNVPPGSWILYLRLSPVRAVLPERSRVVVRVPAVRRRALVDRVSVRRILIVARSPDIVARTVFDATQGHPVPITASGRVAHAGITAGPAPRLPARYGGADTPAVGWAAFCPMASGRPMALPRTRGRHRVWRCFALRVGRRRVRITWGMKRRLGKKGGHGVVSGDEGPRGSLGGG